VTDDDFASRDDPVTAIRNIGPAQEQALSRAGIHTARELRELGADAAYARMLETGLRPHFIGYYVLVMSLAQPTSSIPAKKYAISSAAVSGASEPWTEFSPFDSANSLRIVPSSASAGSVAPITPR
jgi:nucleotidyltransferase/DNA polymerase involved in DNA repair